MKTKTLLLITLLLLLPTAMMAQTDVTDTYMQNPDFAARYAGWLNEGTTKGAVGGFTHQENSDFAGKSGEIYMEKWVATGSKVANCTISQTLTNLPAGTYQLTVSAQNIQQNSSNTQTGAYLFAGDEQTEVGAQADYSVTFTVLDGKAKVGFKTVSATGNWVCLDNFHLYQLGTDADGVRNEWQKLLDDANDAIGTGEASADLQAAMAAAEALMESGSTEGAQEAALALERATLNHRLSNATGSVPTVVTNPYVAQGATIALGRSTVTANGATVSERGFCWSTDPEPTVLDERTTEYFTNNGNVYRMENLSPATIYYVRAYAMSNTYQVGYGDVVKIATKPMGEVAYTYNYGGSDAENYRINSSYEECVWMYNNVSHITGVTLWGNYNSGTPTADCSYGGWMNIGPSKDYQQTGTILHETNHGVGVGTTNEWSSNSNLRENTSSGKWLGPCANEMVQFLQNDSKAFLTGDYQHMWGDTSSSINMKSYGINGANEDSFQPADQLLYWGNILLTHSLHIDGLPCSSSVGFASPSFVFEQWDGVKYYIKCEDNNCGLATFLTTDSIDALVCATASIDEAVEDDNMAWYISFNPKTQYYTFQNAGSGKYISLSSGKLTTGTTAASVHLLPSRELCAAGSEELHSYWMTVSKGSYALVGGSPSCSTSKYDTSNNATTQRWLFLTADQADAYENSAVSEVRNELDELIANVRATAATPHVATNEDTDVAEVDEALENTLLEIEAEEAGYATSADFAEAISTIQDALVAFIAEVTPASMTAPMEITYLLTNPAIDNNSGWSDTPTFNYSCCEYYTTGTFDFNQTTSMKLPAGTYEVRAQAFERPGAYKDVYTDYVEGGTNNVKAVIYAKTRTTKLMNIFDEAQSKSLGSGCVNPGSGYIPNDMQSASSFFANGLYDNSVVATNSSSSTIKLGIRRTSSTSDYYWTCFDNFRLYFYGGFSREEVTPVEEITADEAEADSGKYYDLSGRMVSKPTRGIYIHNGKKTVIK